MHCYYRISDSSYHKEKLPGTDKEYCLLNCLKAFEFAWNVRRKQDMEFRIIADNIVSTDTLQMIQRISERYCIPYLRTEKGNAGSLRFAIHNAIQELKDYHHVYFIEDDYLHNDKAYDLLREGLHMRISMDDSPNANYVTLFDHPDKYSSLYNFGETCKVYKGKLSHWRETQSTCMTFGTSIATLKEDIDVWDKWTEKKHPEDHKIFSELTGRGRKLIVPLPGAAVHTDLTVSMCLASVEIEPWAIQMAIDNLESKLKESTDLAVQETLVSILGKRYLGWDKLKMLQSLWVASKEFNNE